ncbi:MAG: hypothetical protein KF899_00445 [Parvibaculum sp.]|nr:hypothetical protein [Parvibaculum sp.]
MTNKVNNREKSVSSVRVCLLVLGMHRSGTSAISRVLALMGADLPKKLMQPNKYNEAGYWESNQISELNHAILDSTGSSWDDWLRFNDRWYASPQAGEFKARAAAALKDEFGTSSFFILKDPRICRITSFWFDILKEADVQPRVVLPVRNPLEVAASLERRDGFPPELGHLIWLRHVLEAEAASRGVPRFHCSYDELMNDWPGLVARAATTLGFSWPHSPESAGPEIDAFLVDKLRHHCEPQTRVVENPALPAWLRDTFEIFSRWASEGENPADFASLDAIRLAFDDAAPAFARLVSTRQQSADEALALADAERAARTRAEAQLREVMTKAEADLAARFEEIAALTRLIREKELVARDRGALEVLLDPRALSFLPAPIRVWQQMVRVRRSGLFDADWYKRVHKDVAASGMNPLRHYVRYGFREGRAPNGAQAPAIRNRADGTTVDRT